MTGIVTSTGQFRSQFGRIHYLITLDNKTIVYCPNTKKLDNAIIGGLDALHGRKVTIETVPHPKYPKLIEIEYAE